MELKTIDFLLEKMTKIYFYEKSPRTEEQYIKQKNVLYGKIKTAKKEYRINPDSVNKRKLKNLTIRLKNLVSPLEYELSKKTIEEYKKAYSNEIHEEDWCYEGLIWHRIKELKRLMGNKN